jgi:hypothetical protein
MVGIKFEGVAMTHPTRRWKLVVLLTTDNFADTACNYAPCDSQSQKLLHGEERLMFHE